MCISAVAIYIKVDIRSYIKYFMLLGIIFSCKSLGLWPTNVVMSLKVGIRQLWTTTEKAAYPVAPQFKITHLSMSRKVFVQEDQLCLQYKPIFTSPWVYRKCFVQESQQCPQHKLNTCGLNTASQRIADQLVTQKM